MTLGEILSILVGGLVVGALGRLSVPGRDPMPLWLTVLIGIVGSIAGGLVAISLGWGVGGIFVLSVLAATFIVIAFRLFVFKRPLTGPGARG
jgi:uncharacterized membrane protein YeaQ/YmgE (transglycosylase-associated protein family)